MGFHETGNFASSRVSPQVEIDFGALVLDRFTNDTFDDLIARDAWRAEPLASLVKLRNETPDNAQVCIRNTYPSAVADGEYRSNMELLLNETGFVDVEVRQTADGQIVQARRRPLVLQECEHAMAIHEISHPEDVMQTHEFAREYYYYKDFNYDYDVVRQFDNHTDIFAVREDNGSILSIARSTVRVPGHNLPFMYAESVDGRNVSVPEGHHRICEIMALYREGKRGIIAFKRLIEYITQYLYYIGKFDSVWTTYDKSDTFTGTYYKNKFLMRDFGMTLVYRDFGGRWELIFSDRVEEAKNLYRRLFRH